MVISTVLIGLWAENGRITRIVPIKIQMCKKMAWNSNGALYKNSRCPTPGLLKSEVGSRKSEIGNRKSEVGR